VDGDIFVGFSPFDAVAHAFTVLSTGGFSTQNASIAGFHNPLAEMIIVVFMFLGATNFLVHMRMFSYGVSSFIKNVEVKVALIIVAVCSILVTVELTLHQPYGLFDSLRLSVFQVVSIMTGTGYTTMNIAEFPPFSKGIITILMAIGGNIGSTSGAIKILRVIILAKLAYHVLIRVILPPGTVKPMKIAGHVLREEDALRVAGFFVAYIFLLIVEGLILTLYGFDLMSSFSAAFSAVGNVGPSFLPITSSLPVIPKITLIFGMWAGRLEIIPVLILLSPATWRELSRLRERKVEERA